MTKNEMIAVMEEEYGVDTAGYMRKTVKELERELASLEESKEVVGEDKSNEENKEVHEVVKKKENREEDKEKEDGLGKCLEEEDQENKGDCEEEPLTEEVQLGIYETIKRNYDVEVNIRLTNLGAGDLYASEKTKNLSEKLINGENKIKPEESVVLEGVKVLHMTASSRPRVRIEYIK